ncbi:hypothetical protein Q3G72_015863 [Acer saccharum]|nr:hypothetical protein Q3G72_015863 [Acer saccharum]
MAIDGIEAPSLPSQSLHFIFRETMVDLLGVLGRRTCLPMVVCSSSRDELDSVCSAYSNLPYISFSSLYSDLVEGERTRILENFRQATFSWNQNISAQSGDDNETGKDEQKSCMIVVTDACLPVLASRESPISAHVLIIFELPMKKETYIGRIATCLAAVVTLKSIEESSNLVIAEMPINSEICMTIPYRSLKKIKHAEIVQWNKLLLDLSSNKYNPDVVYLYYKNF